MKNLFIAVFIIFALIGCASVKMSTIPSPLSDKKIDLTHPGQTRETSIGDSMFEMGTIKFRKQITFVANNDCPITSAPPGYTYPNVTAGQVFTCKYITDDNKYLCSNLSWNPRIMGGVTPQFNSYLIIDSNGNAYGLSQGESGYIYNFDKSINALFSMQEVEVPLVGSFKKDLVYNGKSGNTIKITYREFKDDLARPAFFQNLEYDLSESKEIGFRDIKITVLSASNSSIKFMVNK